MKLVLSVILSLTTSGCTVQTEAEPPTETTPRLGTSDEARAVAVEPPAWVDASFDGWACSELFAPTSLASGTDLSFLPGLGTTAARGTRERRRCDLRASLIVPRGQYLVSLAYTLGYGGVKPAGAGFQIDSEVRVRVGHGDEDVDLVEPIQLAYDDAFDVLTATDDTSASRRELCSRKESTRIGFSNAILLRLEAASGEVILDVDSVDVYATVAPCPPENGK
jgi:hypothetical protein